MIAETLYCVVITSDYWKAIVNKAAVVIPLQPYTNTGSEQLFNGRLVFIQATLGL